MIDDRTSYLNLPLPNKENFLEVDADRLKASLIAIDAKLAEIESRKLFEELLVLSEGQVVVDLAVISDTKDCQVFINGQRLNEAEFSRDALIKTRIELSSVLALVAGDEVAVTKIQ